MANIWPWRNLMSDHVWQHQEQIGKKKHQWRDFDQILGSKKKWSFQVSRTIFWIRLIQVLPRIFKSFHQTLSAISFIWFLTVRFSPQSVHLLGLIWGIFQKLNRQTQMFEKEKEINLDYCSEWQNNSLRYKWINRTFGDKFEVKWVKRKKQVWTNDSIMPQEMQGRESV